MCGGVGHELDNLSLFSQFLHLPLSNTRQRALPYLKTCQINPLWKNFDKTCINLSYNLCMHANLPCIIHLSTILDHHHDLRLIIQSQCYKTWYVLVQLFSLTFDHNYYLVRPHWIPFMLVTKYSLCINFHVLVWLTWVGASKVKFKFNDNVI